MKIVGFIGLKGSGKTSLIKKISQETITEQENFSIYSYKHGENKAYLIDAPYNRDDLTKSLNVIKMSNSIVICIPALSDVEQFLGELILLVENSQVKDGIIAMTKVDSATEDEINSLKKKLRGILSNTKLKEAKIIETSSITEEGIDEMRTEILNLSDVVPEEELNFIIDSAKEIKKDLTRVYGFLRGGKIKLHDQVKIMPWGKDFIVQDIEVEGETKEEVDSPERAGIGFKGLYPWDVKIGDIVCKDGYEKSKEINAKIKMIPFYKDKLSVGSEVILNVGLQMMKVKISEIRVNGEKVERIESGEGEIKFESEKLPFALKGGERIFVINPDADWRTIRFAAVGSIKI